MRISTTTLESFRLWLQPEQEWMSEQDLLDTIAGVWRPNRKVEIGQAFGRCLEDPDRYFIPGGYRCDGIELGRDVVDSALALIDRESTVFEAKGTRRYGRHDVVAKADQLCGAHLIETKTTFSTFDFDKYAASCQWRFMVDIFEGVRKVTYQVFCLDEHENGVIDLKSVETFDLYAYPALHEDCDAFVREFEAYVSVKGLVGLLDARQAEAA